MGELVDFVKQKDGWSLLCHIILNSDVLVEKLTADKNFDSSKMNIEMKINGVEVPVVESWEKIEAKLHAMIQEEAHELVKRRTEGKMYEALDKFDLLCDELKNKAETMLDKFQHCNVCGLELEHTDVDGGIGLRCPDGCEPEEDNE